MRRWLAPSAMLFCGVNTHRAALWIARFGFQADKNARCSHFIALFRPELALSQTRPRRAIYPLAKLPYLVPYVPCVFMYLHSPVSSIWGCQPILGEFLYLNEWIEMTGLAVPQFEVTIRGNAERRSERHEYMVWLIPASWKTNT